MSRAVDGQPLCPSHGTKQCDNRNKSHFCFSRTVSFRSTHQPQKNKRQQEQKHRKGKERCGFALSFFLFVVCVSRSRSFQTATKRTERDGAVAEPRLDPVEKVCRRSSFCF